MKRLTEKNNHGDNRLKVGYAARYRYADSKFQTTINKLAAYEDLGYEPEELKEKLENYESKLEDFKSLSLWSARRINKIYKDHIYKSIEEITGTKFISLEDIKVIDNCKNLESSYGEICVKCNKCERFNEGEQK